MLNFPPAVRIWVPAAPVDSVLLAVAPIPTKRLLPPRPAHAAGRPRTSLLVPGQGRLHCRFQLYVDVAGILMLSRHVIGREQKDPILADELVRRRGRLGSD